MSLSTTQYGYIVDPMVPFTDDKGKTIKNGFIRVFMAGTSTPVLTYRNYDGATNQEKIELDNSGRVKHNVIGSKGSLYKVVVYNILHSQENPLLTVDKIAVLGASINASGATIVTGLDSVTVPEENFLKATVEGTGVELALDPTEVTSDVNTISAAETAAPDYVLPLLDKTGNGDSKKISLANLFKFALDWISRLATTVTSFASGDFIAVSNTTNGTRKMSKDTLLELTAQNALAGNVAPAFNPDKEGGYKKFEKVVYGGIVYKAKNDIAEGTPWSAADWNAIGIANYNLKDFGNVANTEDLDDVKSPGIYYVEDNTANAPVSGSNSSGWLVVFSTINIVDQIFIRIYNGEIYKRVFISGSWNDWSTTFAGYSYYKGAMPSTIDTNYAEGLWSVVKSAGVAIGGTYPSDIDTTKAMHLLVEVGSISNVQNYVYQTLFNLDTRRYYYRTRISGAWSDWISIASESFCTKYTDDEILKATNEFALIYPYSSAKKLFDTEGNEVSSNFYSYYYNVTEGDIVKVNLGVFSSSNFSVVSLWKNGFFVKSLVNSPTTSSEFVYKITEDADTMIVSYFANATYKALASTNYADVPKPNLLILPNSLTHKGVTFSVGADAKVTLTGTADKGGGSFFEIDVTLTKGQYILTGVPITSNRYNYNYRLIRADSSLVDVDYTSYKQGYVFEVTDDSELVKVYIHVIGNVAIPVGGVVFEPMLQAYPPFTLGFVPYGQPADVKHIYDLIDCSDFNWSGKKMNVIGDSIAEGKAGNWVTIIGGILHLSVARNYGIGGCRMSYYGDGDSVTADDSVVARYADMDDDADIVIVHAGTNDWASQVPLGDEDSQNNLEFNGALNIIMDGLRAKYPTALIIFSAILDRVDYDSPTHGGSTMSILTSSYSEAIKNQCERHKMVFFDGYRICGFDFTYDYSHGHYTTNDGLHPNVGGAEIFGRKMAGFIKWH